MSSVNNTKLTNPRKIPTLGEIYRRAFIRLEGESQFSELSLEKATTLSVAEETQAESKIEPTTGEYAFSFQMQPIPREKLEQILKPKPFMSAKNLPYQPKKK